MAYIGNTPAEAYISISSQTFTTINGTDYTLSSSVTNSEDIALFLNNVRQKPSTYTATGTALTMGTATTTADELYCVYLGKGIQTVTPPAASVGTSSIADLAVTSAKLAGDAVTTTKVLDSNVTYAKIQDTTTANRVIGAATAGVVSEVQVATDMVADDAITTPKSNFISTSSGAGVISKGTSGDSDGYIQLNCSENSHGVKIKSPAHSAAQSYTLTLPGAAPAVNKFIETDGSGNLSFSSVDVTTDITGTVPTANLGTGTASSSTFLRGDQTYAEAGGGKVAQIVQATDTTVRTTTSGTANDVSSTLIATLTPAATSSKILVTVQTVCESPTYGWAAYLYRDIGGAGYTNVDGTERFLEVAGVAKQANGTIITYLDSPNTTSEVSYRPYFSITGGGTLQVGYGVDTIQAIQAMEITA